MKQAEIICIYLKFQAHERSESLGFALAKTNLLCLFNFFIDKKIYSAVMFCHTKRLKKQRRTTRANPG